MNVQDTIWNMYWEPCKEVENDFEKFIEQARENFPNLSEWEIIDYCLVCYMDHIRYNVLRKCYFLKRELEKMNNGL